MSRAQFEDETLESVRKAAMGKNKRDKWVIENDLLF